MQQVCGNLLPGYTPLCPVHPSSVISMPPAFPLAALLPPLRPELKAFSPQEAVL